MTLLRPTFRRRRLSFTSLPPSTLLHKPAAAVDLQPRPVDSHSTRDVKPYVNLTPAAASAVDSQSSAVHPLHQLFCSAAVDLQPAMVGTVDLELDSTRQAKFPHQSSGR
ncbi:hypothetical protein LINPERHAP2_LOCUS27617 [Linum perenne]